MNYLQIICWCLAITYSCQLADIAPNGFDLLGKKLEQSKSQYDEPMFDRRPVFTMNKEEKVDNQEYQNDQFYNQQFIEDNRRLDAENSRFGLMVNHMSDNLDDVLSIDNGMSIGGGVEDSKDDYFYYQINKDAQNDLSELNKETNLLNILKSIQSAQNSAIDSIDDKPLWNEYMNGINRNYDVKMSDRNGYDTEFIKYAQMLLGDESSNEIQNKKSLLFLIDNDANFKKSLDYSNLTPKNEKTKDAAEKSPNVSEKMDDKSTNEKENSFFLFFTFISGFSAFNFIICFSIMIIMYVICRIIFQILQKIEQIPEKQTNIREKAQICV